MKRGIGFGKIGINLGQMKLAESQLPSKPEETPPPPDEGGGGGFGSFSKAADKDNQITNLVNAEEPGNQGDYVEEVNPDLAKMMGFSGFGSSNKSAVWGKPHKNINLMISKEENRTAPAMKKAQQFDVDTMFATVAKSAQEKNFSNNQRLEEEGKSDLVKGFIIPTSKNIEPQENVKKSNSKGAADPDSDEDSDDDFVGPVPPGSANSVRTGDEDEEEEDDEEEETAVSKIPRSHEIKLVHGDKAITSLALDPSGSRVISGGADYDLKLWDFAGMDPSLRSFRKLRPCESHVLNHLEYSTTGDKILVCAAMAQPKVLDRDGGEILECVKGDQYVLDQTRNKGHVATVTSGNWHPKIKEEFMTCALDATCRLWTLEQKGRKSKQVIKCKNRKSGLRANPTCCSYSRDGLLVCAVCADGSIQMWDHRKNFVNVCLQMETAHQFGLEITGVQFSYDNRHLATRGNDETVKLWDMRMFKKAVHSASGLFSKFDQTDVFFSPDDQLVGTCTSMEKGDAGGKLVFFDKNTFTKAFEMTVEGSHLVRADWHPKINQILAGSGDGAVRVYFDPDRSARGAKLCVVKKRTQAKSVNYIASQRIIVPYALPMFKEGSSRQQSTFRRLEKERKNPVTSHKPELPQSHKGTGGRVAKGGSTLASFMAKQMAVKNKDDHIDPREAILRHAKDAEENPYWVDTAYVKTQPVKIFREVDPDEPAEKLTKKESFSAQL